MSAPGRPFFPPYPDILTPENSHSRLLRCVLTLANFILQANLSVSARRIDVRYYSILHYHSNYALPVEADGVQRRLRSSRLASFRIRMSLISAFGVSLTQFQSAGLVVCDSPSFIRYSCDGLTLPRDSDPSPCFLFRTLQEPPNPTDNRTTGADPLPAAFNACELLLGYVCCQNHSGYQFFRRPHRWPSPYVSLCFSLLLRSLFNVAQL